MFQSVDYQTYFGTLIWNLDYYILVLLTIAGMSAIVIWKRREKKLRRLFFWGGGGVVLLLAVGFFWVRQVDLAARKHWNAICQTTAQTYATSFELMEHEKIPSDISAEQTPLFQLLYDACERWQSNNPLIASICTLRKIDDKTYVYILGPPVDYDNDGKYEGDMEDYAPPGTVYKYEGENDPDLVDAITNGELTGSWFPYVFGGSQFLCTSIPMVDSDGVIRSAVMVDFYGDVWIQNVMSARKVPIYATGVFIFVWLGLLVAIVQNRKQEDQRIRIMFDSTPLACHFRDEQSKIVDCNLEAVKLFDLKDKQEYLDRYLDLSPELQPDGERSTEKIDRMVKQVSETGRVVFEWMHCNLNGDLIPSEITFVRTKRGDSFTVAGYTRDLRNLKKTEEERKRYADNLEKAKIEA